MRELMQVVGLSGLIGVMILVMILSGLTYVAAGTLAVVRRKDDRVRMALIIFIGIPLAFAALLTDITYYDGGAKFIVRCVFMSAAIMLPALLFFLFVATRRESLFNAYTANMDRLGLLRRRRIVADDVDCWESESSRRRRIRSYLDRFGAVYGTLSQEFVERFLKATQDDARTGLPEEATLRTQNQSGFEAEGGFELKTMLPIIAATVLIGLGWLTTLPPTFVVPEGLELYLKRYGDPYGFQWFNTLILPVLSPVNFAFLGAYFFSIQMLIRRFVRRDLGPNAYNAVSLRIILATLGVWVVQQVLSQEIDPKLFLVVAFAIGAFPDIAWQFFRNAFKKLPGISIALPSVKTGIPMFVIDGLTVWHEARLEDEDIENVPNLATADMVDLMLNTKFPPHRIIDWIDQAILLTYLGDDRQGEQAVSKTFYGHLRKYGLRTASALVSACESDGSSGLRDYEAELTDAQKKQVRCIASALQWNPNFPLIQAWRGLHSGHPLPQSAGPTLAA